MMIIHYECQNCNYTTENPPVNQICPKCGGKLERVEIKTCVPLHNDDEELTP